MSAAALFAVSARQQKAQPEGATRLNNDFFLLKSLLDF
jgi:hypothetical protein